MSEPMSPSRSHAPTIAVILLVVGVVLTGVGGWQAWLWRSASFGWFAYAPLSEATFRSPFTAGLGAIALVGAGALLAGLGAGILVGRRTQRVGGPRG
ncbi:hypothetical protein EXU48_00235 [Occultella glacieicola]|uniref:Uncharacterized protein n=1 Tax=Occultella glacieicola TaxID=2518684 RepID=A0ABY2E846_9MICO|nr:hypothetical protein [Occultella glacieicola]TDE98685.1 hypothetical protein EXU48_00235 [Occultella glacieicola]